MKTKSVSHPGLSRRGILTIAPALAVGLLHSPAHALFGGGRFSGIVFDPTNYVKNTMTALQQQIDTANGYVQMAQDIKQTARKIGNTAAETMGLNTKDMQQLMDFINTGKTLHGQLRQTQQVYEDMQRVFSNSQYVKWEDFVADIGKRKEHGDRMAKSLYDSAQMAEERLRHANTAHTEMVRKLPRVEGVTDAAIATAESVGIIIQQNQGMLQLMASNSRIQGQELQRQAAEREQEETMLRDLRARQKEAYERDRRLFNIN